MENIQLAWNGNKVVVKYVFSLSESRPKQCSIRMFSSIDFMCRSWWFCFISIVIQSDSLFLNKICIARYQKNHWHFSVKLPVILATYIIHTAIIFPCLHMPVYSIRTPWYCMAPRTIKPNIQWCTIFTCSCLITSWKVIYIK